MFFSDVAFLVAEKPKIMKNMFFFLQKSVLLLVNIRVYRHVFHFTNIFSVTNLPKVNLKKSFFLLSKIIFFFIKNHVFVP